jgi:hypothetical protein
VPVDSNKRKPRQNGPAAARERQRILREQQKRKQAQQRLLVRVGAPILAIVVIIAALVVVKVTTHHKKTAAAAATSLADASVVKAIATIPAATYNTVGVGTGVTALTAITGEALTANGKPRMLYIGAEFCPFCAGERWAVVTALSRFGTFTNLSQTTSSSTDVDPSTATLSFHGATYTSPYLSFTGVETTTNQPDSSSSSGYKTLDTPSKADQATDAKYNSQGSIPFVDFGNKYVVVGASYDPGILKGLTHQQIAQDLVNPSSTVAKTVLGVANMMTAAVCKMTNGNPGSVCTSSGVVAAAAKLPAAKS